jgi:hypothetical protein
VLLLPMTIHMTPTTTVAMLMRSGAIIFFPTARLAMSFPLGCVGGPHGGGDDGGCVRDCSWK